MLVLTRKINESLMIGDDVEVVLIDIKGDQVRLGVRAPRSLSVHRSEVYQGIQEQNTKAAQSVPTSLNAISKLLKKENTSKP